MNTDLIIRLASEISKPLIILVISLFIIPLVLKRVKKKKQLSAPTIGRFYTELEKVIQRANHILDDPVLLKSELSSNIENPRETILKSWAKVDSELKKLAFEHCQVATDSIPYPLDYALFELEMKKKAGNTTLGFYRELSSLKDVIAAIPEDEHVEPVYAAKYDLLARHVVKMLKEGPLPGIAGFF